MPVENNLTIFQVHACIACICFRSLVYSFLKEQKRATKTISIRSLLNPLLLNNYSSSLGIASPPSTSHSPNFSPSSTPMRNNASPSSPPQSSPLIQTRNLHTTRSTQRTISFAPPKGTRSKSPAKTSSHPFC